MCEKSIHSENYRGYTINIYPDQDCQCPIEYDGGNDVCIGLFNPKFNSRSNCKMADLESGIEEAHACKASIVYLVYYDEYNLTYDRVFLVKDGYIKRDEHGDVYVDMELIGNYGYNGIVYIPSIKAGGWKASEGKTATQWACGLVEGMLKEYQKWMSGECYGFVIENNGEDVDSCWGFIGMDWCIESAKESIGALPSADAIFVEEKDGIILEVFNEHVLGSDMGNELYYIKQASTLDYLDCFIEDKVTGLLTGETIASVLNKMRASHTVIDSHYGYDITRMWCLFRIERLTIRGKETYKIWRKWFEYAGAVFVDLTLNPRWASGIYVADNGDTPDDVVNDHDKTKERYAIKDSMNNDFDALEANLNGEWYSYRCIRKATKDETLCDGSWSTVFEAIEEGRQRMARLIEIESKRRQR